MPKFEKDETFFESSVHHRILPTRNISTLPNSTTPSVENVEFVVAGGWTLTITNFKKGSEGQRLIILGDGTTSVAYNTDIITSTLATHLLVLNQVYEFVFFRSKWRELTANAGVIPPLPPIPSIYYDDTFPEGNLYFPTGFSDHWYTANRGFSVHTPTVPAGTSDNHALQFSIGSGGPKFTGLFWDDVGDVTDGEILALFWADAAAVADASCGVVGLRMQNASGGANPCYGYVCQFAAGILEIGKLYESGGAGVFASLGTQIFTLTASTWTAVRFSAVGSQLKAKAWDPTGLEPFPWLISITDHIYGHGYPGLYPGYINTGSNVWWDRVMFALGLGSPSF